ncbi:hypothetical protein HHI36_018948 [Cryptolaemus montrouzieri]|uniref:C2H2-type domain-containing protein n=1 Tax=Cryptolaemus montrouzieri TaxID=559131 RepID=A0ABD2P1J0_9CUCU
MNNEPKVCEICSRKFSAVKNLRRHIRKIHSNKVDELIEKKIWNFECDVCHRHFNNIAIFRHHLRRVHGQSSSIRKTKHKCTLCEFEDIKSEIIKHYEGIHQIVIVTENLHFNGLKEFDIWKTEMEKYTNTSFVKTTGSYKLKGALAEKIKYSCHRSGAYRSSGKGLRKLKNLGSTKMNGLCPASLDVTIRSNGECEVTYIKSHVGHDNDVKYQALTKAEREEIAAKISAKVPFRVILDEIRDSMSTNGQLERAHLITRKDVHNISRSIEQDGSRIATDGLNIEEWVKEMSNKGCILYYKFKGDLCEEYNYLSEDDFVLVIMNKGQLETLQKYRANYICIDRTHLCNAEKMELISLLVVDEIEEGFPCSFLITNRVDENVLCLFYSCIKAKLGVTIEPKVFMSDVNEDFYSAWLNIMKPPEFRFFCSWHVNQIWRYQLQRVESNKYQVGFKKHHSLICCSEF